FLHLSYFLILVSLSLHDALPILKIIRLRRIPYLHSSLSTLHSEYKGVFTMNLSRKWLSEFVTVDANDKDFAEAMTLSGSKVELRSEEHTSELQSRFELVCRLLLE